MTTKVPTYYYLYNVLRKYVSVFPRIFYLFKEHTCYHLKAVHFVCSCSVAFVLNRDLVFAEFDVFVLCKKYIPAIILNDQCTESSPDVICKYFITSEY